MNEHLGLPFENMEAPESFSHYTTSESIDFLQVLKLQFMGTESPVY